MLRFSQLLDVRSEPVPPIADAVWIPAAELDARGYELPARGHPLFVANTGPEALLAVEALRQQDRAVELTASFAYSQGPHRRLWKPNAFLEAVLPQIPPGRALDIACGSGRDAVFIKDAGFEVTATDILPDALEMGRLLERRYAPGGEPIRWEVQDLQAALPQGTFELATCFFYLDRGMLATLPQRLSPGAWVVVETFTVAHRARFGKPRREGLVLQPGELPTLIPGIQTVSYAEGWHGERHTAQLLGRFLP